MTEQTLDAKKVADFLRRQADHLGEVSEFLSTLLDTNKAAVSPWARVMGVASFLRVDAEEMETGLCCCRHVDDDGEKDICMRCGGTGVSVFVNSHGEGGNKEG